MEIIVSVVGFFVTLLIAVIGFFFKKLISDIEKRTDHLESEMKQINNELKEFRDNYLSRFEKVNEHTSKEVSSIRESISDILIKLEKQQQFCYLVQESKKKE